MPGPSENQIAPLVEEVTSEQDPSIIWDVDPETIRKIREIEDAIRNAAAACLELRRQAKPDWRSLHEPHDL